MCSLVLPLAADSNLDATLKALENRYNRAQTLQVQFHESYTAPGRPERTENGTLSLKKPGRMRWDYAQPPGKLFLSDGKNLYLYTPTTNPLRVEKMKLKESEDMRAPLAFLLGKLNFQKEFQDIESSPEGDSIVITAKPKTENLPYTRVEFVVAPGDRIKRVKVTGYDRSVLDFRFDAEKMNPELDYHIFQFQKPKNAEVVEDGQ